jgi:hypothetical protein
MSFKEKQVVIHKTGRPVERPVAFDGDVGKPFHKGAHVPQGVNAVSALSPDKPARIKAGHEGHEGKERAPRPIEGDLLPVQGRTVDRPSGAREHANPNGPNGPRLGGPSKASMGDRTVDTPSPGQGDSAETPRPPKADPHADRQQRRRPGEAPHGGFPPTLGKEKSGGAEKPNEGATPGSAPGHQQPDVNHTPVNPPAPPASVVTPQHPRNEDPIERQRGHRVGERPAPPTPPASESHAGATKPAETAPSVPEHGHQQPGVNHTPVNPPAPPATGSSVNRPANQASKPAPPAQAKETKGKKPATNDKKKDDKKEGGGN